MHRRRKWQPTPVFFPGESQGWEVWWADVMGSHGVRHGSDLAAAAHLKQLEKEEMKNPRVSRWKEILKIRAEINAKEKKKKNHSKNQ